MSREKRESLEVRGIEVEEFKSKVRGPLRVWGHIRGEVFRCLFCSFRIRGWFLRFVMLYVVGGSVLLLCVPCLLFVSVFGGLPARCPIQTGGWLFISAYPSLRGLGGSFGYPSTIRFRYNPHPRGMPMILVQKRKVGCLVKFWLQEEMKKALVSLEKATDDTEIKRIKTYLGDLSLRLSREITVK